MTPRPSSQHEGNPLEHPHTLVNKRHVRLRMRTLALTACCCCCVVRADDPFWWTEDESRLVSCTRVARAVAAYLPGLETVCSWAARLEELRREASPSGGPGTLALYDSGWALSAAGARWARSTVWSRAFSVHRLSCAAPAVALVPVLDMIDHSPDAEVVWHTGPDGSGPFQFVPLMRTPAGRPPANNYGCKTNDELLLAYGFLMPGNPADHLHVAVGAAA
eukprot:144864-Chlamydomonas_euryale.AAC.8